MRVELQSAFVLHTRAYTDSRVLAELFSRDFGRMGAVVRTGKSTPRFALLRPFQPLWVSWYGKTDLKTLTHLESAGPALTIAGERLFCGMYLNELLLRVITVADSHPQLFDTYTQVLRSLAQGDPVEPALRHFELDLLAELGYGIPFDVDTDTGEPIAPDGRYRFTAGGGFVRCEAHGRADKEIFVGSLIAAIGRREFGDAQVLQAAKVLCRLALQPLLGNRPLKSRELFERPNT